MKSILIMTLITYSPNIIDNSGAKGPRFFTIASKISTFF